MNDAQSPATTAESAAGGGLLPLLALAAIAALLLRACVPLDAPPAPAGSVPVFDTALAAQVGNARAVAAIDALSAQSTPAQVAVALNLVVIDFTGNGSGLPDSAADVLQRAARLLAGRPASERYRVTGHTDGRASPLADLEVSRRRAQAVVDALRAQGVDAGRFDVNGDGDEHPLSADPTDEARFRNRRIEFAPLP
jgi:outer membrane protein OmpA-like peptidoglycan-associated protein